MDKEKFKEMFERNLEYMQKVVPPDDIYIFCEQTFMAAVYFLHRWAEHVDLNKEAEENEVAKKWITNIVAFKVCREQQLDINLDLNMESIDDN